jgi:hypothetical protein
MITFNLTFDLRVLFFNLIFSAFCVVIFALFVFVLCVVSPFQTIIFATIIKKNMEIKMFSFN